MADTNIQNRQSSFTRDELIQTGYGELFGKENARLPLPPMLMFDRVTEVTEDGGAYGKGKLVAEFDIKPDLWFFDCHFDDDPVMPGCLGLDALWQLTGFFLTWQQHPGKGRALGVGEVKFRGQILPDVKVVQYIIDIKRVMARRLVFGIADGRVLADGKEIYTARDLRVGLFNAGDMAF